MTTAELIYYGFVLTSFIIGVAVGAMGMALYLLHILEDSTMVAVKDIEDALKELDKGEEWNKNYPKEDSKDEKWLRDNLGD